MTTLPKWFGNPVPKCDSPRRDFYLCTDCGGQSCGGIYSSICTRCGGISSDPPRDVRFDYLCTYCARNRHVCICDHPPPPTPKIYYSKTSSTFSPPPLPPPSHPKSSSTSSPPPLPLGCCCSCCSWCSYRCDCICCCLTCLCQTLSWQSCCISTWKCPCCLCSWSWLKCSCT